MAISDAQKIDLLFKKLAYGVTKTDTNDQKAATNEAIASPLLSRADKLWAQADSIPSVAPGSTTGVVRYYSVYELEADITATTNRTWKTNLTDWIPPEFGSTYQAKIYIHTSNDSDNAVDISNQVFAAGSGNNDEWYFDYQAGVLNFIGTNLPSGISGNSVYIRAYTYVGNFGLSAVGFDSDQIVNIINENAVTGITDSDLKAMADLRNDLDSDYSLFNSKFASVTGDISTIYGLINLNAANIVGLRNDVDSESAKVQDINLRVAQNSALINLNAANIANLRNDLDSETARIQLLLLSTDSDALSIAGLKTEADSDAAAIAELLRQADSDATAIQELRTDLTSDITTINARLDSDETIVQSLQTQIDNISTFDSDQVNSIITEFLDSDVTIGGILTAQGFNATGTGVPTVTSGTNIILDANSGAGEVQITGDLRLNGNLVSLYDSESATNVITSITDSDYVINRTPFRLNDASFATTASNQVLDTFDKNEHNNVKYIISVSKSTDWQSSEAVINHNGTTAYVTEYAVMDSGAGDLYTIDADVNGNDIRLLISPTVTNITVSTIRTQID